MYHNSDFSCRHRLLCVRRQASVNVDILVTQGYYGYVCKAYICHFIFSTKPSRFLECNVIFDWVSQICYQTSIVKYEPLMDRAVEPRLIYGLWLIKLHLWLRLIFFNSISYSKMTFVVFAKFCFEKNYP